MHPLTINVTTQISGLHTCKHAAMLQQTNAAQHDMNERQEQSVYSNLQKANSNYTASINKTIITSNISLEKKKG